MAKDKATPPRKKRTARLNASVGDYVNTSGRVIEVQKDYVVVQIGDADVRLSKSEIWNPDDVREGRNER